MVPSVSFFAKTVNLCQVSVKIGDQKLDLKSTHEYTIKSWILEESVTLPLCVLSI